MVPLPDVVHRAVVSTKERKGSIRKAIETASGQRRAVRVPGDMKGRPDAGEESRQFLAESQAASDPCFRKGMMLQKVLKDQDHRGPNWLPSSSSLARMSTPRAKPRSLCNSIQVSHNGGSEPSPSAITWCLPGCAFAGSWNWERRFQKA